MHPVIYAADIGSIKSDNFGWARLDPEEDSAQVDRSNGIEIAELVDAVADDIRVGKRPVALGFECPLFVPVPEDPGRLGAARFGEGNRPFSGGPGTGALVTGLVQTAWVLRALRARCPQTAAFLDWDEFTRAGSGLYLWEAFVTGDAKAATHVDDAVIAATTFHDSLPNPLSANAVEAESPLSLIAAALLWSGWSCEASLLDKPCLVIKAASPDALDHPVAKANHVVVSKPSRPTEPIHERVSRVAVEIPRGTWTTYGDVAKMTEPKSHAIPVGQALAAWPIPNAHRILTFEGKVSKGFAFPDGQTDDPIELLKAEGIRFINGRADPRQRWRPNHE